MGNVKTKNHSPTRALSGLATCLNRESAGLVLIAERSRDISRSASARERVRVTRVAEAVADSIRELILRGEFCDGERLPRVESLTERFGVAATAVREAVRILETEGLVVVRRGSRGGAIVRRPDATTAAYMMTLVLRSRGAQLRDVFEARVHIEALCAMLCARRPDRKQAVVPQLRTLISEAQQIDHADPTFIGAMSIFHQLLVQSCGSESITLIAGVVETIVHSNTLVWAREAAGLDDPATLASKERSIAYHEEICQLIDRGEDIRVSEVMAEHSADMCLVECWFNGIDLSVPVDASVVRLSQ